MMKTRAFSRIAVAIAVAVVATSSTGGIAGAAGSSYRTHWAQVFAGALDARGCLAGPLRSMDLDAPVSRGAFAHLLLSSLRLVGSGAGGSPGAGCFKDVPWDYWAAPAITSAYERGWAKGPGGGLFLPDASISRVEAVAMLVRALRPRLSGDESVDVFARYPEEPVPGWAGTEIEAAVRLGWLKGDPAGRLRLMDPISFGEACALVCRGSALWGGMYDVEGTAAAVDGAAARMRVSSDAGILDLGVSAGAALFRNGNECHLADIGPLDEIRAICGSDGAAVYVDARLVDDAGIVEGVDPEEGGFRYVDRAGSLRETTLARGVRVFVQGNKSLPESVVKGDRVYILFDTASGEVRLLDACRINVGGRITSVSGDLSTVRARVVGSGDETLELTPGTVVYVNSVLSDASAIRSGDRFQGSALQDGRLLFVQILRAEAR